MAKITIELDTSNDEDAALAAKLFAGAPPKSRKGGDQEYSYATSFPPIQPRTAADLPPVTPHAEAYDTRFGAPPPALADAAVAFDEAALKKAAVYFGPKGLRSEEQTASEAIDGVREAAAQGAREALAAPPAPGGQTQDLDAAGLPWDARIHSESRARIADGTWRRKRGVDQVVVDLVTSELRASYPTPSGQPAPAPAPVAAEVPPPPAAPVVAPPPPPAARGVPDLAAAVARGTLSLADLNAACLLHGCANVLELNKNPAALTAVCAQFDAIGAFNS